MAAPRDAAMVTALKRKSARSSATRSTLFFSDRMRYPFNIACVSVHLAIHRDESPCGATSLFGRSLSALPPPPPPRAPLAPLRLSHPRRVAGAGGQHRLARGRGALRRPAHRDSADPRARGLEL